MVKDCYMKVYIYIIFLLIDVSIIILIYIYILQERFGEALEKMDFKKIGTIPLHSNPTDWLLLSAIIPFILFHVF